MAAQVVALVAVGLWRLLELLHLEGVLGVVLVELNCGFLLLPLVLLKQSPLVLVVTAVRLKR